MPVLQRSIKWIMLVSGFITSSMLGVAFAPQVGLDAMFGTTLEGPLAEVVVRNWAALIGIVGLMLIYAAFRPVHRKLVLTVAIVSKMLFMVLILANGFGADAAMTLVLDGVFVLLFIVYLVGMRDEEVLAGV